MWLALSTQHSALKTFFCRLITSALLFGALLSNAAGVQMSCLLGIDHRWNEPTPAAACEKFFATTHPVFVHRTVASTSDLQHERYLGFDCIAGLNQSIIDQVLVDILEDSIQGKFTRMNGLCACPTGIAYSNLSGTEAGCKTVEKNYFLTLTPVPNQKDPRPKGTETKDGKSTYELIAKVMEGSTPKAGAAVTFKVKVKEGSGEHGVTGGAVHDHKVREENHSGKVPPSGVTNGSGEARIKFEAPILAGTHTITATCDTCSNKTATKDVKVLVPDLVALTADTGNPKTFKLIGGDTPLGKNHPENHYFTDPAINTLRNVVKTMYSSGWGVVGVNDGSLHDGGLFDIKGLWTPSHFEHRTGTEVDLSFTNPKQIGGKAFEDVYTELCKAKNAAFDIQTLWHKADGIEPHFHMYLDGTGLRADAGGRCCAQVKTPKKDKDGIPVLDKKGKPVMVKICE